MARRDGELVAGITAYADGPDEMREVIRHHVNLGVDQIKLSMSGEEVRNCVLVLRSEEHTLNSSHSEISRMPSSA